LNELGGKYTVKQIVKMIQRGDAVTKADLIESVAKQAAITHVKAEAIINTVFDSMAESLKQNRRVEIRGFGTFVNRTYGAYKGRNPRTGKVIDVSEKCLPHFKAGKELKIQINEKFKA
jgi:integration host factor subunit beta